MTLDELARESPIGLGGSSTGSVFQDRLPKARRLAQAHAPRDHSLINAFSEMLAYLRHNLLAKVSPTIEHRHDNPAELEALVGAWIPHLADTQHTFYQSFQREL